MTDSPRAPGVEAALAAFVAETHVERLPRALAAKARLCLVDGVGASMTLARRPEAGQALATLGAPAPGEVRAADRRAQARSGGCPAQGCSGKDRADTRPIEGGALVTGDGSLRRAEDAAFVNAVAAAATIRSDTHAASASHPGMVVLPVVLALAQAHGASAEAILGAVIAGYEVSIRLGLALVTPELARVFRPTGLTGAVGAAAAAARVLGADAEATRTAMALAANTACGLNEWARAGTSEHVFHAGIAARNAILAVRLALAGARAAPSSLGGPSGLLAAYGGLSRAGALTDGLGEHFHMLDVVHKRVPACVFAQAPCQAALALACDGALDPRAIASIEIGVTTAAATFPGCDFTGPFVEPSAAEQSIAFGVASVIVARGIDEHHWAHPADAGADALAARCRLVIDPALDAASPARLGASLTLRLSGGEVRRHALDAAEPMGGAAIDARFLSDAEPLYGTQGAATLLHALRTLGDSTAAGTLFDALVDERIEARRAPGMPAHSTPLAAP